MLKYINITKNIKERIVEAQHNVILAFFFFLFSLKLNTIKTIDKINIMKNKIKYLNGKTFIFITLYIFKSVKTPRMIDIIIL